MTKQQLEHYYYCRLLWMRTVRAILVCSVRRMRHWLSCCCRWMYFAHASVIPRRRRYSHSDWILLCFLCCIAVDHDHDHDQQLLSAFHLLCVLRCCCYYFLPLLSLPVLLHVPVLSA